MTGLCKSHGAKAKWSRISFEQWMARWLILALLLAPLRLAAGELWSDTPPSPSIAKELQLYKAATTPEGRAAAVARLEQLGQTEPEAWNQLGLLYLNATPADAKLAESMFNKAATARSINGLMNVIDIRISGGRIAEACKAAEAAVSWPNGGGAPAVGYLGNCYRLGRNGPKNIAKAKPLLFEACRWGWTPSCDTAMTMLRGNPTLAGKKEYREYLENLSKANYETATYWLAIELSNSTVESEQERSIALFEKASAAKYGPACTSLALELWGRGNPADVSKVNELLECGVADDGAPELAWAIKGAIAGLSGYDDIARASLERSYAAGFKQAGAFSDAFGYSPPMGADPAYCEHFCDWLLVIKEATRLRQLALDEHARQAEIDRVAREMAAQEAATLAAQRAAYNAQVAAQNAEARRERRRRFWGGVLTVALALATGYVQAQANAYTSAPAPRAAYQPPAISTPYRPIYQPQQTLPSAGLTKVCYVTSAQGIQSVTVNATQACPVSVQSMGQPLRFSGTGYLVGESVSGRIKICLYNGASGQSSLNVSSTGICPLSHHF